MWPFSKKAKEVPPNMADKSDIFKYWKASSAKACGNCMYFTFPVSGASLCMWSTFNHNIGGPGTAVNHDSTCDDWERRTMW